MFAQVVLNKSIITDPNSLNKVVQAYSSLNSDGYTIWIDDLNEHEATREELTGFVSELIEARINTLLA